MAMDGRYAENAGAIFRYGHGWMAWLAMQEQLPAEGQTPAMAACIFAITAR
jgi:hypothetical protein